MLERERERNIRIEDRQREMEYGSRRDRAYMYDDEPYQNTGYNEVDDFRKLNSIHFNMGLRLTWL